MSKSVKLIVALLLAFAVAVPVMAEEAAPAPSVAKLTYGDKWIDLHFLFQMQGTSSYVYDRAAGEGAGDGVWTKDFAVRRARILLNGQAAPNLTFFMDTDVSTATTQKLTDSSGDTVNVTSPERKNYMYLQDAYLSYKFADEFMIDAGKILLPFMHHNRQSAATLLGVDYALKYVNLPLSGNSIDFWRDYGFELRGLLLETPLTGKKGLIDYRIGVFDGTSRTNKGTTTAPVYQNKNDNPRFTGRVQINLMDPEDGFFYAGTYLGKKKIFSFGGGMDYQQDVFLASNNRYKDDYFSWTADVMIDMPVDENAVITLQGGYVKVKNSPSLYGTTAATQWADGSSYFVEAGLLLMKQFQPVMKYIATTRDKYNTNSEDNESYLVGGLNYYINGHNANIKFEYQHPLGDEHKDISGEKKFTLQGQLFI